MKAMMIGGPRDGEVYTVVRPWVDVRFPVPPSFVLALESAISTSRLEIDVYERAAIFSNGRALYRYAGRR